MSRSKIIPRPQERADTNRAAKADDCLDPALANEAAMAIEQLEDVVLDVKEALAERRPKANPGGTVSEVTQIVDGPKERAAEEAAHRAVEKLERASRGPRKG